MITIFWSTTDTQRSPDGGDELNTTIGSVDLDVLRSEVYEVSSNLTTHPVDDGAPISDHVRPNPRIIQLECVHSDSPTTLVDGAEMSDIEFSNGGGATVIQLDSDEPRTVNVFDALSDLVRTGNDIWTDGLMIGIEGWIITAMSMPRDVETAGASLFGLTLQEARRAETQEVDAPSPRVERGRRSRDRGRQSTQDTGSDDTASSEPEDRQSVLASGHDWLAGLEL